MSNRFMISVAALALIAGTGLANAQGTINRESGGAGAQPVQQQTQPSGGAAEHGATGKNTMTKEKGTVGQAGGTMKPGAAAEEKSSGAIKDEHSSGAMNKNAAEDKAGATKGQHPGERAQGQMDKSPQGKSKSMSSETTTKSGKDMKAEDNKAGAATKSNAENRPGSGTSTDMKAEGKNSPSTTVGQAGAGAKLSTEQRTQITSVIREERVAPVTNVNFSISIGTRVPREGIELHALPSRAVTIYPEWRNYRYVLVREQIVIIDPTTYEIVAVLDV